MRCGSISVKEDQGDEEEVWPRAKPRQRHGRRSAKTNPYATRGLDKFAKVYAELSAKRESIAAQTGAPESLVRFVYSRNGWTPLVVRIKEEGTKKINSDGHDGGGVSILASIKTSNNNKKPRQQTHKQEGGVGHYTSAGEDGNIKKGSEPEKISISVLHEISEGTMVGISSNSSSSTSTTATPWSQYLKYTAFGLLTVSAIFVWKSARPATAMAVVMVVGTLQRRWHGGVMCMRKFIDHGLSYISNLLMHWKPQNRVQKAQDVEKTQQVSDGSSMVVSADIDSMNPKKPIKNSRGKDNDFHRKGLTVSAPTSPLRTEIGPAISTASSPRTMKDKNIHHHHHHHQEHNIHHHHQEHKKHSSKGRKFTRIVSMDSQSRQTQRLLQPTESYRRLGGMQAATSGSYDITVGASVLMITLLCLVFSGRLCAIFCTSLWWYLIPRLREPSSSSSSYHQQPEHRNLRAPNRNMGLGTMSNSRQLDLQSNEYKKKVIMDGLLNRNRGKP